MSATKTSILLIIGLCTVNLSYGILSPAAIKPSFANVKNAAALTAERNGALRLRGGEDCSASTPQRTLAIIKPDANDKADQIKDLIKKKGFHIIKERQLTLSKTQAEEFYREHKGKPFYDGLVKFMTSGPVTVMILQAPNGIKAWRAAMGPTNSLKAREESPDSIRALFGTDGSRNAAHGSDSVKSAAREISFYFGFWEWLKVSVPLAQRFWSV